VLKLGLRNLYIVPTGFGLLWLGGALLLQLVGIQTQSNGPLLLSFVMLALLLLSLHLTHGQLEGLEVRCAQPEPTFAEESAAYPLIVRVKSACEGLEWRLESGAFHDVGSLGPGEHLVALAWTPHRRGWQRPGKLRLQTTAPLGLFVCWSRWQLPAQQLIYPARNPGPVQQVPMADWRERPQQPGPWRAMALRNGRTCAPTAAATAAAAWPGNYWPRGGAPRPSGFRTSGRNPACWHRTRPCPRSRPSSMFVIASASCTARARAMAWRYRVCKSPRIRAAPTAIVAWRPWRYAIKGWYAKSWAA
jgi:hypothetical protein